MIIRIKLCKHIFFIFNPIFYYYTNYSHICVKLTKNYICNKYIVKEMINIIYKKNTETQTNQPKTNL